jgi:hypothetical protein
MRWQRDLPLVYQARSLTRRADEVNIWELLGSGADSLFHTGWEVPCRDHGP